jgi:hypothetical protein
LLSKTVVKPQNCCQTRCCPKAPNSWGFRTFSSAARDLRSRVSKRSLELAKDATWKGKRLLPLAA